jgi:protocatechuate 3,4-dioxygenase beta subunit
MIRAGIRLAAAAALLSLGFVAIGVQIAAAQVATASVTGTVVIDGSVDPISDATVTLYAPMLPGGRISTQTDDAGTFRFTDLAGGRYQIGVSKQGFVPIQEGQRHYRAAGRPFTLRDGDRRAVHLRLPRLGVVTGRIVDERGNPMVDAFVRALSTSMAAGYPRILSKAEARTDDRGMYRFHSLWPDRYLVCASTRHTAPLDEAQRLQHQVDRAHQTAALASGPGAAATHAHVAALEARLPARIEPVRGYAPMCHAATGIRAPIVIGPGEERAGVDLRLVDTRLARIEGTVTGLAPGPDMEAVTRLLNQDEALPDVPEAMRVDGDGRFRFWHVPPGRYAIVVTERSSSRNPSPMRWLAAAPLVVGSEDVTSVVLDVPKSARVRGEVVLRGATDPAAAPAGRVEVRLEPAHHDALTRYVGPYIAAPDASGRFELSAVAPGVYHLSARVRDQPPSWFLDAVRLGSRDLLVDTLEVTPGQTVTGAIATLVPHRGSIGGTLVDGAGEPLPGAAVLVYPADERYRGLNAQRIRYAVAAPDGHYVASGLPPGKYRVAALVDAAFGAWYEPGFLRRLDATSIQVSIAADEQKRLTVRSPDR